MEKTDLFDIVFNKIKKISIPIILILTLLLWQSLGVLGLEIFGISYESLSDAIKIIVLFILDLLLIGLLIFIYHKDIIKDFKAFFNKNLLTNIKTSFNYWIIGLIIMVISNYLIAIITNGTLANNEETVRSLIDKYPIYMAFQVMIYAPLTEEIIFRKSIRKAINNKFLFILVSGLIFGGLHVISSVESLIDLIYLVPYCSLGIILALLYTKTDNIFSSITAHAYHNTLALILYLIG